MNWFDRIVRRIANENSDEVMPRLINDKYTDNMLSMMAIMKKTGFFSGMELLMRAAQGEAIERPLGSHLRLSPWEMLLLNPVHLWRFPVEDNVQIKTEVTIGPQAEKPLKIGIPIMITGMSYGSALSKKAKIALAEAANQMKTATNTGESGLLAEERETADLLVGQYNRGGFLNSPDKYQQLDAIEIQLGQGAQGASPQKTQPKFIDEEMREVHGVKEGEPITLHSRFPDVNSAEDFIKMVKGIKDNSKVPVGVKFAATHFLEKELEVILDAPVDFIVVDGAEAGTHAASPTVENDLGLPLIYGLSRARRFLDNHQNGRNVSLIASGGLITPGQFLKALALGADAVYIGTAAVMALSSTQMTKVNPLEPSTQIMLHTGRYADDFDISLAAKSLANFLKVSMQEIEAVMYAIGHEDINELARGDLCCLDPFLAKALGVDYAGVPADDQTGFYGSFLGVNARQPDNQQYLH